MGLDRLYLYKSERHARENWTGEDDEGDVFKSSRGFVVDRREHEDFGIGSQGHFEQGETGGAAKKTNTI